MAYEKTSLPLKVHKTYFFVKMFSFLSENFFFVYVVFMFFLLKGLLQ